MTRKPRRLRNAKPASEVLVLPLRGADSVRWSRVRHARLRIASGFYNRDEVQTDLVEAVLRELKRR